MLSQERTLEHSVSGQSTVPAAFVSPPSQPDCGGIRKVSAKANLHHLCAAKHWKQPVYECCNQEGPDHHKLFTFKVVVNNEEGWTIVECYGNPKTSKKAAAEDAAEGAIWCLKHLGFG